MHKKLGLLFIAFITAGGVADAQDGADRAADEAAIKQVTHYVHSRAAGE